MNMKKILTRVFACAIVLAAFSQFALGQFAPGQILTAAQLNAAFANVLPITGGTLTGPLTVPMLNTANAQITGGTISGISPIPIASGGTGANSQSAALAAILGASAIPLANGGTGSTTPTGGAANLQYLPTFTGAVARAIATKFADRVSVCDVGGCSGGDVSSAFQSAVNALPSGGGVIDVPDGAYTVNTAPTLGTKSVTWNFSPNAVITGTQTTFPRMFTNAGIPAVGPFIQSRSQTVAPTGDATCVMCVESLPPSSLNGGVIGIFAGTNLTGNGAAAIATAQNLVATAQNGSSGNIWGQEIDVGMFAPTGTGTQFGLSLNGLGTGNPTFGIKIDRADSSKWQQAIDIRNAQIGINIENTTGMNNALVAGTIPTIYSGTTAMIGQMANSGSALILQRFTNTSPSGYLINAINANNTGQLFSVDVGGNTFTGGQSIHAGPEIDKSYTFNAPTSGSTVTMANTSQTAIIAPSGPLAALTITLPTCSTAYDGAIARFSTTAAITSVTVTATSGSVVGAPTTLAANAGRAWLCHGANTAWYPLY